MGPRQRPISGDDAVDARARLIRRSCARRCDARPDIAETFLDEGAERGECAARWHGGDGDLKSNLRRQRHGLALAVALGDLAGELSLEQVTRLLSDFADRAIDAGAQRPRSRSAFPAPSPTASR